MESVAVVILNWNGAAHLRRFLPSVVACSPQAAVVVVDNGSTDDSVAVVEREFPSVRLIRLPKNYGFAEGYDRALESVDAEYCVLLNSDVETPEGWLEPLIAELDADAAVAAVAPKLLSYDRPDEFEYAGASGGFIDWFGFPFCRGRILQSVERDRGQYDDARDVFWVSGAAFCCRRSVFRALGGFDASFFAHMEEIDLCWRMQLAGYRVRIVPQSRVWHLGGGTLSNDSPDKLRLNYRNNLSMLYKCASPGQRAVVAVVRPVLDALSALIFLLGGDTPRFRAVWRAYREFWGRHRVLAGQRRAIRSSVCGPVRTIYKGSVVLRYFCGGKRFGKMM